MFTDAELQLIIGAMNRVIADARETLEAATLMLARAGNDEDLRSMDAVIDLALDDMEDELTKVNSAVK